MYTHIYSITYIYNPKHINNKNNLFSPYNTVCMYRKNVNRRICTQKNQRKVNKIFSGRSASDTSQRDDQKEFFQQRKQGSKNVGKVKKKRLFCIFQIIVLAKHNHS